MCENITNGEELSKALEKFRKQYPAITSADMQTFILGWQAAEKIFYKNKILKSWKNK